MSLVNMELQKQNQSRKDYYVKSSTDNYIQVVFEVFLHPDRINFNLKKGHRKLIITVTGDSCGALTLFFFTSTITELKRKYIWLIFHLKITRCIFRILDTKTELVNGCSRSCCTKHQILCTVDLFTYRSSFLWLL